MNGLSVHELHNLAERLCVGVPAGESLTPLESALIAFGVSASVSLLDSDRIDHAIGAAFDAGASPDQVQEILALVSGLGVHSLMATVVPVLEQARARGLIVAAEAFDPARQALWDRYVGDDPFWAAFSQELPGFLSAMLHLSPDLFIGFFDYCAIPWKSDHVRARIKELTALACDATPSHRFGPGFRAHLANALKLGVGRKAIMETLEIAAEAPVHRGYS